MFRFNVRRHQMLYCPKREEINPRDLGLGKTQGEVKFYILKQIKTSSILTKFPSKVEAETEEEMEVGEEDVV